MSRRPPQHIIDMKRKVRMERFDAFDPEIRSLIHEYGSTVVDALWDCGVRKPNQIKHCVETVLNEFSPTRGASSNQGQQQAPGYEFQREA